MGGAETRDGGTGPRALVVVVEDYIPALRAIELALEADGFRVIGVDSGPGALEVLAEVRDVSAIVLDMRLRAESGADLAKRLREMAHLQSVPIVVVSGVHANDADVQQVLALPRVSFLAKPFRAADLQHAVQRAASDA